MSDTYININTSITPDLQGHLLDLGLDLVLATREMQDLAVVTNLEIHGGKRALFLVVVLNNRSISPSNHDIITILSPVTRQEKRETLLVDLITLRTRYHIVHETSLHSVIPPGFLHPLRHLPVAECPHMADERHPHHVKIIAVGTIVLAVIIVGLGAIHRRPTSVVPPVIRTNPSADSGNSGAEYACWSNLSILSASEAMYGLSSGPYAEPQKISTSLMLLLTMED